MSEVAGRADFSGIRYAQCWEDADVLLAGLDIQPGDRCLGIASAGDNCLAMLTADPAAVVAVDLSPAQLACLGLRVAAYRCLEHHELLELIGSRPSRQRLQLYRRCRDALEDAHRHYWDAHQTAIVHGIGAAGKFERYFALFRNRIMPWIHDRRRIHELLSARPLAARHAFYDQHWSTLRWRVLFHCFFSRQVMGRAGRDPAFFTYVDGSVAEHILARTRHALRELDPASNPYLQWILRGRHGDALPLALREEHFTTIRSRLDRLSWRHASIEAVLADDSAGFDRYNLSDIFEYMSADAHRALLTALHAAGRPGGRLLYWNMLVPRSRPDDLADQLEPLPELAAQLLAVDKAWFYSRLQIEVMR